MSHLNPFNKKDFQSLALQQRIANFTDLTTLYPDVDKVTAFGYLNGVAVRPGYVSAEQRMGEPMDAEAVEQNYENGQNGNHNMQNGHGSR